MKKYLLFLGIIGLFALTACGKQAKMSDVTIDYGSSSIYSKEDMDAAIKAIKTVFKDFDGCELHSLSYSSVPMQHSRSYCLDERTRSCQ